MVCMELDQTAIGNLGLASGRPAVRHSNPTSPCIRESSVELTYLGAQWDNRSDDWTSVLRTRPAQKDGVIRRSVSGPQGRNRT